MCSHIFISFILEYSTRLLSLRNKKCETLFGLRNASLKDIEPKLTITFLFCSEVATFLNFLLLFWEVCFCWLFCTPKFLFSCPVWLHKCFLWIICKGKINISCTLKTTFRFSEDYQGRRYRWRKCSSTLLWSLKNCDIFGFFFL